MEIIPLWVNKIFLHIRIYILGKRILLVFYIEYMIWAD